MARSKVSAKEILRDCCSIEQHFHPRDPEKEPELRQQTLNDIKAVRKLLAEIQGNH